MARQSFELNILAERVFTGAFPAPHDGVRDTANRVRADS
jgi:hypothetical protein